MNKMLMIIIVVIIAVILIAAAFSLTPRDDEKEEIENKVPIAVITSPQDGQVFSIENEIEFSAASSSDPDGEVLYFDWRSNMSGKLGSSEIFKSLLDVGAHEITLTVSDSEGGENSTKINITIYPLPFISIYLPPKDEDYYSNIPVFLNGSNSSSKYSSSLNYTWTSDLDGVLGNSETLFINLSVGTHTITLEISDGLTTQKEQITLEVKENKAPIAVINSPTYNDVFLISATIFFDASFSSDPENHELFFNWTSNVDGLIGTQDSFYATLSAGTHIITLIVNDSYGGSTETSTVIMVNTPPVADAGVNLTIEVGEQVEFDASNSNDPDGDELTYKWDLGDGNKDMGKKVDHTYNLEGIYNVTLTIDDGKGGVDNDTIVIEVVYVFKGTGVYGHVYNNKTLKPMKDIEIELYNDDWYDTESDISGYYEFNDVSEGEYWLEVWLDGYYDYSQEITIVKNQGIKKDIYIDPYPPETAKIYGNVYDNETKEPPEYGYVSIFDEKGYNNYSDTDEDGYYEMKVPAGDFIFVCSGWDWVNDIPYDYYYVELTLSDNQELELDIYLLRFRPAESNITIKFKNWNEIDITTTTIEYSQTGWMRDSLDANDDGEITQAEVDAYENQMELMVEIECSDLTTQELLLVDEIDYLYIKNSIDIEIGGAVGPVTSTNPITTIYSMDLKSNHTVSIADTHEIKLMAEYDDPLNYLYIYYIELPTFPSTYEMTNYTESENVNVTNITGSEIIIDPLEDPNDDDEIYGEWVAMEATKI